MQAQNQGDPRRGYPPQAHGYPPPNQGYAPTAPNAPWPTAAAVEQPDRIRVGRRWLPWRNMSRSATSTAYDWMPTSGGKSGGDDPVTSTISLIFFVICLPFLIPALFMSIIFLIESLAQWIVLPFAIVLRLLGVIPVEVDARDAKGGVYREKVKGWGRAMTRRDQLKQQAARSIRPRQSPFTSHA